MADYYAHESSIIDPGSQIGKGTKIWHFCHLMSDVQIGKNCIIGQNSFIASGVKVGNNVKIQNNVSVYKGVILEDDVFLGPSMVFTNVLNPRSFINRRDQYQTTLIKQGATIGANATIVCGITLGKYSFIGAGAVVTKDVPDYGLIYGNPGLLQGWMCQCGERLDFKEDHELLCPSCQCAYRRSNDNKIEQIKIAGNK